MKLTTKFTLLVTGCTFLLLGSYYFMSIHSASNAFLKFNQQSVVLTSQGLLNDALVSKALTKQSPKLSINEKFARLSNEFPNQQFMLVNKRQKALSSVHDLHHEISYIPVDNGYQFKIVQADTEPLIVQFNQGQMDFVVDDTLYELFWFPRSMFKQKQAENRLLTRLADEFMLSLLVLSLIAAGLSWLGAWYFLRPLKQLKMSFLDIEHGKLDTRISVQRKDEVGEILSSFNNLASWLQGLHQQYKQMNSDLSHELRTPLHAIGSRIEAMEDGLIPMDSEQLQILARELKSINRLIDDLSLLSITESNQLSLQYANADVTQMLKTLVERYTLRAKQAGIELNSKISPNITATIDEQRVRQIVINLIDNAFKYGASGKEININLQEHDTYLAIEISDNGQGMNSEQQSAVFERFYRIQQSRSDNNSLGLGLPICMHLAQLMNSELSLVTSQGEGASFTLKLSTTS